MLRRVSFLATSDSIPCHLWLDSVPSLQVPETHVVGELGKGYKYAIEILNVGRIGIGAQVGPQRSGARNCSWMMIFMNAIHCIYVWKSLIPRSPFISWERGCVPAGWTSLVYTYPSSSMCSCSSIASQPSTPYHHFMYRIRYLWLGPYTQCHEWSMSHTSISIMIGPAGACQGPALLSSRVLQH